MKTAICAICGQVKYVGIMKLGEPSKHTVQISENFAITVDLPASGACYDCIEQSHRDFEKLANIDNVPLVDGTKIHFDRSNPEDPRWYLIKDDNQRKEILRTEAEDIIRRSGLIHTINQDIWRDAIKLNQPIKD